jgi:hypothetical protein
LRIGWRHARPFDVPADILDRGAHFGRHGLEWEAERIGDGVERQLATEAERRNHSTLNRHGAKRFALHRVPVSGAATDRYASLLCERHVTYRTKEVASEGPRSERGRSFRHPQLDEHVLHDLVCRGGLQPYCAETDERFAICTMELLKGPCGPLLLVRRTVAFSTRTPEPVHSCEPRRFDREPVTVVGAPPDITRRTEVA